MAGPGGLCFCDNQGGQGGGEEVYGFDGWEDGGGGQETDARECGHDGDVAVRQSWYSPKLVEEEEKRWKQEDNKVFIQLPQLALVSPQFIVRSITLGRCHPWCCCLAGVTNEFLWVRFIYRGFEDSIDSS